MPNSLVIRSPLLPDETLSSLLIRLAKANFYDTPYAVIQLCRKQLRSSDNLNCPARVETYQAIEELVQIDAYTLHQATVHRYAHVWDSPKNNCVTLPNGQIVTLVPSGRNRNIFSENDVQYCPLCLREEAYHRLIWLPRAVTVCLKHQCLLVYKCPRCRYALNTLGIVKGHCHRCGLSLPQVEPIFVGDDEHGLLSQKIIQSWFQGEPLNYEGSLEQPSSILYAFMDGLWLSARYIRHWAYLHPLPAGDEQGVDDEASPLRRFQCYATVVKALLNWPQGFHGFLDAYLLRLANPLSYRIHEDFGHIFNKCISVYWNSDGFQAIHRAFDEYLIDRYSLSSSVYHLDRSRSTPDFRERLPYVPVAVGAKMLGVTPETMMHLAEKEGLVTYEEAKGGRAEYRLTLVKRADVLKLKEKWENGVSVNEAAQMIGTSPKVVRQLLRRELVKAVRGQEVDGSYAWSVDFNSLRLFVGRLRFKTRHAMASETIPIILALQMLSAYKTNLAGVIDNIFEGVLKAHWPKEAKRLDEMFVSQDDISRLLHELAAEQP